MVIRPTKKELLECTTNALMRYIAEGKSNRENKRDMDFQNRNKKSPKHSKMKPQGKEKYKGNWKDDDMC